MPFSVAFWFVVIEVALEKATILILPLALNHLTLQEYSNILLPSFCENICAFSFFLSIDPIAGVNVSIFVSHHTFSVTFTIFPIPIIVTYSFVMMFADSTLQVINPFTVVERSRLIIAFTVSFCCISVDALSVSDL